MNMNWLAFAVKVPELIKGTMLVVDKIKDAPGPSKKAAVIDSVPAALALSEFAAGRDVFNDPAVLELVSAYIDAEHAAQKAKHALHEGLLAKAPAVAG